MALALIARWKTRKRKGPRWTNQAGLEKIAGFDERRGSLAPRLGHGTHAETPPHVGPSGTSCHSYGAEVLVTRVHGQTHLVQFNEKVNVRCFGTHYPPP